MQLLKPLSRKGSPLAAIIITIESFIILTLAFIGFNAIRVATYKYLGRVLKPVRGSDTDTVKAKSVSTQTQIPPQTARGQQVGRSRICVLRLSVAGGEDSSSSGSYYGAYYGGPTYDSDGNIREEIEDWSGSWSPRSESDSNHCCEDLKGVELGRIQSKHN